MENRIIRHRLALCAVSLICLFSASAGASVVWDLNPSDQNAPTGSTSEVYTSQGYSITAYGFDNNNGTGTPHELFFKSESPVNGASEVGLGLTNTVGNELQVSSNGTPFHFIQFDLTSILAAGLTDGRLSVGSIQSGEAFNIYGSNALGTLGTQLGGDFGSSFDNQFVALPDFGVYKYYSVVAAAVDVLPVAVSAEAPVIPEMSALLPIIALVLAVVATNGLRRRRDARAA